MAVETIKAERVVRTILGVLERETVMSRMVWLDPAGDFRGAKGDTITIRVPAYTNPDKRDLRSGTPKTKSSLTERKVDVSLDTDLYKVIPITDEELTLDIDSFDQQITAPVASSLVRGVEDEVIDVVEGATYVHEIVLDEAKPFNTVARARRHLNDSRVPMAGRALAVGSAVEEVIITADQFVHVDQSGSDDALREAMIGRVAGFNVFTVPGLAPEEAYAFHRTAYTLSTRAPFVPRGVAWGQSLAWEGFALRVAQQVDPDELVDNFHADIWSGVGTVPDYGTIDADGFFQPSENPDLDNDTPIFVRAVKIGMGS